MNAREVVPDNLLLLHLFQMYVTSLCGSFDFGLKKKKLKNLKKNSGRYEYQQN